MAWQLTQSVEASEWNLYIQGSTYLFEALPWKAIFSWPYFGLIRMKTFNPTNGSEKNFIVWNYSFSNPTSIFWFKFSHNNIRIKCKICSNLTAEAQDTVLGFLLLTWIYLMFLMHFFLAEIFFFFCWMCVSELDLRALPHLRPSSLWQWSTAVFKLLFIFCHKTLS